MALRIIEQAGRTDVGRQRSANEDSLVVDPPLFAVADGMGGAKAGEVASAVAVEAVEGATESGEPAEAQLASIVRQANRRIYDLAVADESRRGMGTTLTLAKVHGDEVSLAHVGDSRAYRLRDGELEQLTRDHSLVAELERSGQITPEAAEHHPQRSIITRALGPEPDVEVDTYTLAGRDGDLFLICSDGLTSMISDDEVGSILRSAGSLDEAADELVRAANQSGGKDNITVILFRLGEGEAAEAAASVQRPPGRRGHDRRRASAPRTWRRPPRAASPSRREPLTALGDAPADATVVRAAGAARRAARRRRSLPRAGAAAAGALLGAAVALLLVAAVLAGLYALSRQVYFIGTNDAGLVTVYRGLPYELPLGINLYEEDYASGMPARAIPAARRARVLDHEWRSRDDAVDLVRALERGRLDAGGARQLMSARTRELFGLLPVSLLVAAGFAAVLATRTENVSDATLTYGAFFLGLCVLAHLFIRARLPDADPYMFPLAAALAGIGLVLIYRIDAELAREQAQWFVVGLAFFCITILADRGPPRARALPLHDRGGEHRAAAAAAPARHRRPGERSLPRDQGRLDPVPAGRVREARDHHLPRELPARDGRHPGAPAAETAALPAPDPALGDPGGAHAARDRRPRPRPRGLGAPGRLHCSRSRRCCATGPRRSTSGRCCSSGASRC